MYLILQAERGIRVSKKWFASIIIAIAVLLMPAAAFAHVVVQPADVGIGKTQVFSISVPAEKTVPTIGLRIVLPSGLQEVTPTVKAGWQIQTKTSGTGDNAEVSEIDWTGGSIPPAQRDEFSFSAQVPGQPTTLQWKAYQTYQDSSIVSWDQTPSGNDDASGDKGPYSTTQVVDDLTRQANVTKTDAGPYILAGFAVVIAIGALLVKRK